MGTKFGGPRSVECRRERGSYRSPFVAAATRQPRRAAAKSSGAANRDQRPCLWPIAGTHGRWHPRQPRKAAPASPRGADPAPWPLAARGIAERPAPARGGPSQPVFRNCADGEHIFYAEIGEVLLDRDGLLPAAISPDQLHFTEIGYALLAARLEPELDRLPGPSR